jgi:integrase
MMGSLGDPKDEAPARQEKEDDYRPSGVQEVFKHRFIGYVLSVSGFRPVCQRVSSAGFWDHTAGNIGLLQRHLGHKSASSSLIYLYESDARKASAAVAEIRL